MSKPTVLHFVFLFTLCSFRLNFVCNAVFLLVVILVIIDSFVTL